MPTEYSKKMLEDTYAQIEKDTSNKISRGELITINGKTIRELIAEEYYASHAIDHEPAVYDYYLDHMEEATSRYVEKALEAGDYVEMFTVGTDGQLTGEPQQLTAPGRAAVPLNPELEEAVQKSRELVKKLNCHSLLSMDEASFWDFRYKAFTAKQFLGDQWKKFDADKIQKIISHTVLSLAAQGMAVEDIFDSGKYADQKRNACAEVQQKIKEEDKNWLHDQDIKGQTAILDQIDDTIKDFHDFKGLLDPKYRGLHLAEKYVTNSAHSTFVAYDPKTTVPYERCHPISELFEALRRAQEFELSLTIEGGCFGKDGYINSYIGELDTIDYYTKQHIANPDQSMSSFPTGERGFNIDGFSDLNTIIRYDPQASRLLGRELLSGNLQKDMDFTAKDKRIFDKAPEPIKTALAEGLKLAKPLAFRTQSLDDLNHSIQALTAADKGLLTGSSQYQNMLDSAKEMAQNLKNMDNPPTYAQIVQLQTSLDELQEKTQTYLKYKGVTNEKGVLIDETQQRSSREIERIEAAKNLRSSCMKISKTIKVMDQVMEDFPEVKQQKDEFAMMKEYVSFRNTSLRDLTSSIESLRQQWVITGSDEYGFMLSSAIGTSDIVKKLNNPPSYNQITQLNDSLKDLMDDTEAYLKYKGVIDEHGEEIQNPDRKRSSREIKRIAAAKQLYERCKAMRENFKIMDQVIESTPKLKQEKEAAEKKSSPIASLQNKIFEQRKELLAFTKLNKDDTKDQTRIATWKEKYTELIAITKIHDSIINEQKQKSRATEQEFSKDPKKYIQEYQQSDEFKKFVEELTPEKWNDFLANRSMKIGENSQMKSAEKIAQAENTDQNQKKATNSTQTNVSSENNKNMTHSMGPK